MVAEKAGSVHASAFRASVFGNRSPRRTEGFPQRTLSMWKWQKVQTVLLGAARGLGCCE
jgi:hypothetical protein